MKLKSKDEIMSKILNVLDDEMDMIKCSTDYTKENHYYKLEGWSEALEWVLGTKVKSVDNINPTLGKNIMKRIK